MLQKKGVCRDNDTKGQAAGFGCEIQMKTVLENKGMQLFTFLPVKSSFTMSNILIDKTVVQDLILGDKGSEYW
jgi:hypothetical protein